MAREMWLWRVTGWSGPETSMEFNVGLFVAASRDEAIARARKRDRKVLLGSNLVLDAAAVCRVYRAKNRWVTVPED